MPPAPVRAPCKRSLTALPESSRLTFLLTASQLLADKLPEASSHLGTQAFKVATPAYATVLFVCTKAELALAPCSGLTPSS